MWSSGDPTRVVVAEIRSLSLQEKHIGSSEQILGGHYEERRHRLETFTNRSDDCIRRIAFDLAGPDKRRNRYGRQDAQEEAVSSGIRRIVASARPGRTAAK